ncbi:MAG: aspartyl/glutamyl-tRNA amidotransferase subunit C [Candidatus Margulisiibacteriota bacterium]
MSQEKIDVHKLAELANIELTEAERTLYATQIDRILGHMEVLEKANLDRGIAYAETGTPLRTDRLEPRATDFIKSMAPKWENGCFSVPKIGQEEH